MKRLRARKFQFEGWLKISMSELIELSFNGENIQELLVKEGHAEIYKKYSKPCEWAS